LPLSIVSYSTNIQEIPEKQPKSPQINSPYGKKRHGDGAMKGFNKIDNFGNEEEVQAMGMPLNMSERELNLLQVRQRFKQRTDPKKLYEEDFYLWQANNPITYRMQPYFLEYEENSDRIDH